MMFAFGMRLSESVIQYDAHGNILTFKRNGDQSGNLAMDDLAYEYYANTNKLRRYSDQVSSGTYANDLDNTSNTDIYEYDESGNLIKDNAENLTISWTPYGKIALVDKGSQKIKFEYDGSQQRVMKRVVNSSTDSTTTYYIRDAQGNVMGVYSLHNGTYTWKEQHLYGSSRLGLLEPNITWNTSGVVTWIFR